MSNSLDRAAISTKLLDLQKSPRHSLCTNVQELSWSFPAQLIPHAWLRASGHVRGFWCIQKLSHGGWVSSCQGFILDALDSSPLAVCVVCMHFIFLFLFFSREISRRNIEALVTLACLLPLHLNSQGLLLPCTEWVWSSVGFCNVVEVTPPWVMMNWSCVYSSRGCPWAQTHKLVTWFTKLPPASRSDWSIAGGKKTRIPPLCVQPHRASTSTRGSGGAHLVLLEPSGNTSLCICFSKSWMHPALQDTDRETERFWAGEVEAAWKQNWDWFVSMWVNMGFPYPFCDQEKVGNYCNLNLKKLSKIQSKH